MPPLPAPESIEARLLDIARAHVRKFGAARTTIVGIAAEAGMTHANVYRYFPSKLAVLEEITAGWLRPVETRLREAADGADPAYDKLERMLLSVHRAYREKLDNDPALFDLLIDALARERASATACNCQHARAKVHFVRSVARRDICIAVCRYRTG